MADDPKPAPPPAPPPPRTSHTPAVPWTSATPLWRQVAQLAGVAGTIDDLTTALRSAGDWINAQIPAASPETQARYAAATAEQAARTAAHPSQTHPLQTAWDTVSPPVKRLLHAEPVQQFGRNLKDDYAHTWTPPPDIQQSVDLARAHVTARSDAMRAQLPQDPAAFPLDWAVAAQNDWLPNLLLGTAVDASTPVGALSNVVEPVGPALHAAAPFVGAGAAHLAGVLPPGLTEKIAEAARGIRAYHGSPHDFDKFALSKIGTGEGAQAYGHGLYFAENEGVARSYRDQLARGTVRLYGQDYSVPAWRGDMDPHTRLVRRLADIRGGRRDTPEADVVALASQQIAEGLANPFADHAALQREMEFLNRAAEHPAGISTSAGGKMYEVHLNVDPTHLLDWDKALLPQQREQLAGVLPRGLVGVPEGGLDMSGGGRIYPNHHRQVADKPYPYILKTGDATFGISERDVQRMLGESQTGQQAYTRLTAALGSQPAASAALQKAGIPGIRYADQQSRGLSDPAYVQDQLSAARARLREWTGPTAAAHPAAEAQRDRLLTDIGYFEQLLADTKATPRTSNYTIFDDSLIDILRKYGILPPLAAGAAASQLVGGEEGQEGGASAAPRHWLGASFLPDR